MQRGWSMPVPSTQEGESRTLPTMLLAGEGLSEAVAHPWMDVRWVAQANGTIGPNASVVKWQEQLHVQVCVEDFHGILIGRRPSGRELGGVGGRWEGRGECGADRIGRGARTRLGPERHTDSHAARSGVSGAGGRLDGVRASPKSGPYLLQGRGFRVWV